jgi:CubicO group peptidase (beta-lactamase class C family)
MKKFLFLFLLSTQLFAQSRISSLPRSTPEAEGVSSEGIANFIEAANKSKHEFHSYMIVRHGKVVSEGWWNPYRADLKHTLYSCSKSFTATAVGFAVAENRLTVEDKVISFFPNDLPDSISENLAALRVRDLLSMSVGNETDPTGAVVTSENWVKTFLKYPIKHKPSTKFLYNTSATYMLSAIVQKVTGEKILDYLKPRLFDPLSIEGMDWEVDPHGINVGGYGLRLKTEDMAKFALLFLQKGVWQGKQIIPASWIEEASTMKILQSPDMPQAKRDSSDWQQGYCYQMWRSRHNSYRGDGANGQYMLVLPEHDAVIAITCETQDMQGELNLVWEHLLPAFSKEKTVKSTPLMPSASSRQGVTVLASLNAKNAALAIPITPKSMTSPLENTLNN